MISSAYSYYLSTYGGRQLSKYDSHKQSELRSVYDRMVKVNRKSPLFKLIDTDDVQKYAIDLKETAREFKNVAASLTGSDGRISGFLRMKAVSSNDDIAQVEYIGEEEDMDNAGELSIKVNSLAKTQINTGNYLSPSECTLKKGDYSFDMPIGEYTYEFSFGVKDGETNKDVQDKLVRLFNRANIGIVAKKQKDEDGNTAIVLESVNTGTLHSGKNQFDIVHNTKSDRDVVRALGLANVSRAATDASVTVNGEEYSTSGNVFTVSHEYQITLNKANPEEYVEIKMKQDFDYIVENVNKLVVSYNDMVDMASKKTDREKGKSRIDLGSEIQRMARFHRKSLEEAGFGINENGHLEINRENLVKAVDDGRLEESLDTLNRFKKALVAKADDISIDPMKYVDKKLISYPNPNKNLQNPYVTSIYSGMMFNGYV